MSKSPQKDDRVIEYAVRQFESSINDISMNNTSVIYGPILTDENCSQRNLNKFNNSHNSLTLVSANTESNPGMNIFVYGSDIKLKRPIRLGKTFSFCYVNDYPYLLLVLNVIIFKDIYNNN